MGCSLHQFDCLLLLPSLLQVATCPDGMSKCHIDGKGVCVPSLDGKVGHDLCQVFKAVCHKGTIVAKSCS